MNDRVPSPSTPEGLAAFVRGNRRVLPVGAGTKPALAAVPPGHAVVGLRCLAGVRAYEPQEFTFTALAGTPVRDIQAELARNGQHLPFDPPFVESGATLGGTIAAGLSGPGRYRTGGVRDFILGVLFATGDGELVRGGGKVVKNAAGFDLPKLMVGSLGRLGVIVEATFKVFPRPPVRATVRVPMSDLAAALESVRRLGAAPFELDSLDFDSSGTLTMRLGGTEESLPPRLAALERFLGRPAECLHGGRDAEFWRSHDLRVPSDPGELLVKVPLTPRAVAAFDLAAAKAGAARNYSVGGNLAWVRWPAPPAALDALLKDHGLSGLVLAGPAAGPLIGVRRGGAFLTRVKAALDPEGRFPGFD